MSLIGRDCIGIYGQFTYNSPFHICPYHVELLQGLAAMMQGEENLAEQAEEGEHGLLVSQILETKKSMEEELRGKTQIVSTPRTRREWVTIVQLRSRLRQRSQSHTKYSVT